MKQVKIEINDSLHKRAKSRSALDSMTLKQFCIESIKFYLRNKG